jgi:endonuclease/exonuclease/phosphatase family metal-dependent hydrolase
MDFWKMTIRRVPEYFGYICFIILMFCGLASLCTCGCTLFGNGSSPRESLRIVSWNVQNLFDGTSDGGEYPEYDPSGESWSTAAYHDRLKTICEILSEINADIIILQEIEHEQVLIDMSRWFLKGYGKAEIAAASGDGYSTSVGIISRLPILKSTVHASIGADMKMQRPMLKTEVLTEQGPLVCIAAHWKSRIGGIEETAPARRGSSILANRLIEQELAAHPGRIVLLAGDLNTSIADSEGLLPPEKRPIVLDPDVVDQKVLTVTGDPLATGGAVLYDFWQDMDVILSVPGSYCYQGQWQQFDHIIGTAALFDGSGFDLGDVEVYTAGPLLAQDGTPNSWSIRRTGGVSDHLPVIMDLCIR